MSSVNQATNAGAIVTRPQETTFWAVNAAIWSAYAGALMIPWLGRYSVLEMLPNKLAIAAIGVAVSGGLRAFYRWLEAQEVPKILFVWLALVACLAGAVTFDVSVIAVTQGPDAVLQRLDGSIASIVGGVPMPGRIGQYLTLLVAWSLGLSLFERHRSTEPAAKPEASITAPADATISVSGTTIRARDGNRTILLERDEIDWIGADGDYIRVHSGTRNLLVRATMKHSSAVLAPLGFVRVHRSAIVNPRRVREVVREGPGDHSIVLRGGARVRAGRNYAAQVGSLLEGNSSGDLNH